MSHEERTIKFSLFRLILEREAKQQSLGDITISRADLLKKLIEFSPQHTSSNGSTYLTSKITTIDNGLYFKFGIKRSQKSIDFDDYEKDFFEKERNNIEYVKCLYDPNRQLLAIENKKRLPSPITIAHHLATTIDNIKSNEIYSKNLDATEKMLLSTSICKARHVYEPTDFIEKIKNSYKVSSFKITMLIANPIDFNDAIKKPLDKLMEDTGAAGSNLTLQNKVDGLHTDRLTSLSRDLASYGAGAEAYVIEKEGSSPHKFQLNTKNNLASVIFSLPHTLMEVNFIDVAGKALKLVREKFRNIHEGPH